MSKYVGDAIVGKTISKVIRIDYIGDIKKLALLFSDGTFTGLEMEHGYEAGDEWLAWWNPDKGTLYDEDEFVLVELGLITNKELENRKREKEEEGVRQKEEWERRQYEVLKEKFEK